MNDLINFLSTFVKQIIKKLLFRLDKVHIIYYRSNKALFLLTQQSLHLAFVSIRRIVLKTLDMCTLASLGPCSCALTILTLLKSWK